LGLRTRGTAALLATLLRTSSARQASRSADRRVAWIRLTVVRPKPSPSPASARDWSSLVTCQVRRSRSRRWPRFGIHDVRPSVGEPDRPSLQQVTQPRHCTGCVVRGNPRLPDPLGQPCAFHHAAHASQASHKHGQVRREPTLERGSCVIGGDIRCPASPVSQPRRRSAAPRAFPGAWSVRWATRT